MILVIPLKGTPFSFYLPSLSLSIYKIAMSLVYTLVVFTNITMMAYSRQFSSKKWLIFDPNSLIR